MSIFARLGFESANTVSSNLDTTVVTTMGRVPQLLNTWQTTDTGNSDTTGYFVNPCRVVTGNSARAFLEQIDSSLYNGDRKVLRKIISRDLSCGFGIESINKVWPGLVPTVPYIVKQSD